MSIYNSIIDPRENTLSMQIVKNLDYNKLKEVVIDPEFNPYIKNIYRQSFLDLIKLSPFKDIEKLARDKKVFLDINKSSKDRFLIYVNSSLKIHQALNIKDKNVIQNLYKNALCLDTNTINNPFLLNKLFYIKNNFPNTRDKDLLTIINHNNKNQFFYLNYKNFNTTINCLTNINNIKIINKIKSQKDLLLLEDCLYIIRKKNDIKYHFRKNISNTSQLRKFLMINITYERFKNIEHLKKLNNLNKTFIFDQYQLLIPSCSYEFLNLAYQMNNCLTDYDFFLDFIKNKKNIFYIKNGRILYCIELDKSYNLKIILKKYNKTPTSEEKMIIKNIINLVFNKISV